MSTDRDPAEQAPEVAEPDTPYVIVRRGWRIDEDSIFCEQISNATDFHQDLLTRSRENMGVNPDTIGLLKQRLWIVVVTQTISNLYSRGRFDRRVMGRMSLNAAPPLIYLASMLLLLESGHSSAINVGVTMCSSGRNWPFKKTLVFLFSDAHPADHEFYSDYVRVAFQDEAAEPLYDRTHTF